MTIPLATFGWPDQRLAGRVWTSTYASPLVAASGLAPTRITLGAPRWRLPYQLQGVVLELAPPPETFRKPFLGPDAFRAVYGAKLDGIGLARIRQALDRIRDRAGADPVLLCFEDVSSGTDWCHRLTFAAWFEAQTGEPVLELRRPAVP